MSQQHTLTAHTELGLMLGRLMQVEGTHALVVSWCMVLAEVVAQVGVSWLPVNSELSLFNTVLEPVESHVDGFGAALLDSAIEDSIGTFVVSLDGGCRLGMAELDESLADGATNLCVVVGSSHIRFGSTAHDIPEDVDISQDGSIERGSIRVISEVVVATNSGVGFGAAEVGGISVDAVDHLAGLVADDSIRMGGSVVEELDSGLGSGLSAMGLFRAEFVEGNQHGVVHGTAVEEEGADDLLEALDAVLVQGGAGVNGSGFLGSFGTAVGFDPSMGCMLWFGGGRVLEALKGFGNVVG